MLNQKPIHILRYGTVAEKTHIKKAFSAFDYLSINGNTAAYVSNAISSFIVENFFSSKEKGYFIDPITYAFQNNIDLLFSESKKTGEKTLRKSILKLINEYKLPTDRIMQRKPFMPNDFGQTIDKEEFVKNVIGFQYNLVYRQVQEQGLEKYLKYVVPTNLKDVEQLHPKFVIAPYFYLDPNSADFGEWLDLNIEFDTISNYISEQFCNNIPVFAQIVLDKSVLTNARYLNTILSRYATLQCEGYTIWIDDFDEHGANQGEIRGFAEFLSGLRDKPVYNMYGGYLSVLFTHKKLKLLAGVSHGLEYGESRKVYPVGGGIPVSKYNYLPLHQRLDFTKAFYLLESANIVDLKEANWGPSEKYYAEICHCSQCRKVIKDEMINFINFESREFYESHYGNRVLRRKKTPAKKLY